ncbi:MAG: hypothetical protein QM582_07125 [Micropruina sp.]|uniref:hypothetical protein n=1 Tax=Micropruina sp. TaxID=2737536 RepID=UPI0039E51567
MTGRVLRAACLVIVAALVASCSLFQTKRSLGVKATDVAKVELYGYTWGDSADPISKVTIENSDTRREPVQELVTMFTDMPVSPLRSDATGDAAGKETLGVRYTLNTGTTVEVTRILVGLQNAIVIWPDGTANRTDWGSPDLIGHYSEIGSTTKVDPSEPPQAKLPG